MDETRYIANDGVGDHAQAVVGVSLLRVGDAHRPREPLVLAAPAFATADTRANVSYSFYMDNTLLNVSQVTIEPSAPWVGKTLSQVERELDLTIVQRNSATQMDLSRSGYCHRGK